MQDETTPDSPNAPDIDTLTLASIAHRCAEETKRWVQRAEFTLRYCYELFRRAMQLRDQQAWELVIQQYGRLMQSWAARHSQFAATGENVDFFVNGACAKLWERITPEKFANFPDVKSILRYLQMCLHSSITDYMRAHSVMTMAVEFGEDELKEERVMVVADNTGERATRNAFWDAVNARLKDDKERLVIRGLFVFGMKPSELLAHHPKQFRDVKEIYSIRENVIDRLSRDGNLRVFVGE
jgi:hypothetical protein